MTDSSHKHIKLEDLTGETRQIAEIIGLPALLALSERMGGGYIYVARPDHLALSARDRAIRAEFNGRNVRELAARYNLTLRRIRQIIGDVGREELQPDDDCLYKQQKLF